MKHVVFPLVMLVFSFQAQAQSKSKTNPAKDWKFGVALWTFHTFNFEESLKKVDSAKLKYIEPNTFHKVGRFSDSLVGQLSPASLKQLKKLVDDHHLITASIYIDGGKDLSSWKNQFEVAKQFGVKYVTAEPPVDMWDSIDSLAGIYKVRVAIHDHWKGVSAYWHPDSVLAAIKDHPNFGACADLGHWPKSGVEPVEALKKLEGHIIGIHLKDIAEFNNPALRDVPVGTGVVNFPAVFNELKRQHFKGYIYIERDAEDQPSNLPSVLQTIKYYYDNIK